MGTGLGREEQEDVTTHLSFVKGGRAEGSCRRTVHGLVICLHGCRQVGSWSQGSGLHLWLKADLNPTQI